MTYEYMTLGFNAGHQWLQIVLIIKYDKIGYQTLEIFMLMSKYYPNISLK